MGAWKVAHLVATKVVKMDNMMADHWDDLMAAKKVVHWVARTADHLAEMLAARWVV